jgi:pantothenate synthetase
LDTVADIACGALVAVAAYVGGTRLIDNIVLHAKGHRST